MVTWRLLEARRKRFKLNRYFDMSELELARLLPTFRERLAFVREIPRLAGTLYVGVGPQVREGSGIAKADWFGSTPKLTNQSQTRYL